MTEQINEDMLVNINNTLQSENENLKRENKTLKRKLAILNKQIEVLKYFSNNLSNDEKQIKLNEFLIQYNDEHIRKYYKNSYEQLKWN